MKEIKVSIIVPVYNVERYLIQCMESLVNQTLEDIEIITVNDGSPDNSIEILKQYEKKYPEKVTVYSTENKGVSHARNYGIDRAHGEYIMFVDSDDFVELDMAEKLYTKAVEDNNDLVMCARYNVYEIPGKAELKRKVLKIFSMNQNFRMVDRKFEYVHASPFPWDKLFKRSIFKEIRFPEGIRFEDLVVAYETVAIAENIGVIKEPLYNYRKTTQGGFLNSFSEATYDIVTAFELLFDFMREHNLFDTFKEELGYICTRHFFYRYDSFYSDGKRGKLELKIKIINATQDFLNTQVPGWEHNHYMNYTAAPSLKKHLKYYVDKDKTIKYVTLRDRIPGKVFRVLKKLRRTKIKFAKKWRKFKKSKRKIKFIKKKLGKMRMFKIFHLPITFKYTKYYETLKVNEKDILFESKHGDDLAGNIFSMILETGREKYKDYRVFLVLEKKHYGKFHQLLKTYNINHVHFIEVRSDDYVRALATAKYLVTDTSFPPYYIKKQDQVYLNTWHGTPLKAMGRSVANREYALGNVQRNFNMADYLLYQNEFSKDVFLKDYMIDKIYEGKVLLSGYPRNSSFYRTDRRDIIRKECELENMQVMVYMPTWRGLLHKKQSKAQVAQIFGYLAHLDLKLKKNQVLYVKLHPFVKKDIDYSEFLHIREFPSNYETYDFLNASDMLITDYSSIMFDYAVSKKKIILFTYDREEYLEGRGIYIGLDEMDLPKCDTVEELIAEINHEEYGYPKFFERFCSLDSADTAKNVCDMVFLGEDRKVKTEVYKKSVKPNVLIHVKSLKSNEDDLNFIHHVKKLDRKKYQYFIDFKAYSMKKSSQVLSYFSKDIGYFPLGAGRNYRLSEYLAFTLTFRYGIENSFTKRKLKALANREKQKNYGNTNFEYIIFYSGMDLMLLHLYDAFDSKKVFCFHDFNLEKYEKSKKYRKNVNYVLNHLENFTLAVIPTTMDSLQGVKDLKLKIRVISVDDKLIKIDRILKEAK